MTKATWFANVYPPHLLPFVGKRFGNRTLRLFACACAQRVERLVKDARGLSALRFAERMSERDVGRLRGRPGVYASAREACTELWARDRSALDAAGLLALLAEANATRSATESSSANAAAAATDACTAASLAAAYAACRTPEVKTEFPPDCGEAVACEERGQLQLLRDITGNPFREVRVDPTWRTSDVVSMARGIRTPSDFDRMPVLADALQDAGCENADLLDHCRGGGPHAPGCWAVELLLGRVGGVAP